MEQPKYELKNDPSTQISCLCGKVTVIFHLPLLLSMEELRGTQRMPWLPVIVSLFHFLLSNQNQSFYFFNERKPFFYLLVSLVQGARNGQFSSYNSREFLLCSLLPGFSPWIIKHSRSKAKLNVTRTERKFCKLVIRCNTKRSHFHFLPLISRLIYCIYGKDSTI